MGNEPFWWDENSKKMTDSLDSYWLTHMRTREEWLWLLGKRKYDHISLEVPIRFEMCVHVCSKWVSGAELSSAIYSLIHNSSESQK